MPDITFRTHAAFLLSLEGACTSDTPVVGRLCMQMAWFSNQAPQQSK
jgi:hypothetical protein